jgi:hypothetical protein
MGFDVRAKLAAGKGAISIESLERHPAGAKALGFIGHFAARLKPCPFKTGLCFIWHFAARLKPCPFKTGL